MIVVIADDFSGAAELAGVAWRHGLSAEVHLDFDPASTAQLVAVDTDSRSLSRDRAAGKVGDVCRHIVESRPEWIYKKTDSVFRGHLTLEIGAILDATDSGHCLLIPANPSKDRVIENGRYRIGESPLDQTVFAEDPEFPARSDRVSELLGPDSDPRIVVPDSVTSENLDTLAAGVDRYTLPAGGADFFEALLKRRVGESAKEGSVAESTGLDRSGARLFVCGSLAAWPDRSARFDRARNPVFPLPPPEEEVAWRDAIAVALEAGRDVLAAIGDPPARDCEPVRLVREFGQAIATLLSGRGLSVDHVFLEGGATAIAVLNALGTRQFRVIGEAGPGAPYLEFIGRSGPVICPKPGSYPWPVSVLK